MLKANVTAFMNLSWKKSGRGGERKRRGVEVEEVKRGNGRHCRRLRVVGGVGAAAMLYTEELLSLLSHLPYSPSPLPPSHTSLPPPPLYTHTPPLPLYTPLSSPPPLPPQTLPSLPLPSRPLHPPPLALSIPPAVARLKPLGACGGVAMLLFEDSQAALRWRWAARLG